MDGSQPDMRRAIRQRLESLERSGVTHIPHVDLSRKSPTVPLTDRKTAVRTAPVEPPNPPVTSELRTATSPSRTHTTRTDMTQKKLTTADKIKELEILNQKVQQCTMCDELARTRTQTVFGVGNPDSRVVFFGEAPGADEDRQGEPFVGRAGQLLTKIIEACGFQRSDVYILNTLKCRPPGNRNPLPEEVANCRPYFEQQLDIIAPEFIVCLGAVAAMNLLDTKNSIGKLRGKVHEFRGIRVIATYHPAYLLRNPAAKKYVWEDMKLLLREMGLPIPKRS